MSFPRYPKYTDSGVEWLAHMTPHGLRSYFVTQARQSGLSDADIAMLIGDKTGPSIIALTYGDVRPDHLFKQAQRIRLTVQTSHADAGQGSSIERSIMSHDATPGRTATPQGREVACAP